MCIPVIAQQECRLTCLEASCVAFRFGRGGGRCRIALRRAAGVDEDAGGHPRGDSGRKGALGHGQEHARIQGIGRSAVKAAVDCEPKGSGGQQTCGATVSRRWALQASSSHACLAFIHQQRKGAGVTAALWCCNS